MSTVRNTKFGGIVTDGMLLCLDAAKKESYSRSGTQWDDISGNNHIGTLYGNPVFDTEHYGEFTLDGTGDYFRVPQDYGDFSNSICSYEIWCYPTSFPTNGHILFMDRPTFDSQAYGVEIFIKDSSGYISVRGSSSTRADSTDSLNLNAWNHIVVTFSSSTVEIYTNNVFQTGLTSISEVVTSTYDLFIGRYPTIANTYDWNGKISVARVYDKVLSSDEVTKNYNALKGRYGL